MEKEGYVVRFFTQKRREYEGVSLASWIVAKAKEMGVQGATLFAGKEGFGHDGLLRSENFFDYQDAPLMVTLALTYDECERLMACLEENNLRIFYTKSRVSFGFTAMD